MGGKDEAEVAHPRVSFFIRMVSSLSTVAGWSSACMIVAAVAITCQMIVIRFVLNGSTIWQTEVVVYLVVAATLIGLPYVQSLRGHVSVDLIPILLPPRLRFFMAILTLFFSIVIILVMLFYGYEYWYFAWERNWKSDTVWGVRLWIPYLVLPVGFGLFFMQLLADFFALCLGIDKPFGLE